MQQMQQAARAKGACHAMLLERHSGRDRAYKMCRQGKG